MHAPFTIFPRKSKIYGKIYYVRFRNPETGDRLSPISSGHSRKADAMNWAINQLTDGLYKPKQALSFKEFTSEMFIWDKCNLIKYFHSKNQRFSHSHADNQRSILKNHLLPYFKDTKLCELTVSNIEDFLVYLSDKKKYATSSISSYYSTLSLIIKEAYRLGYIDENPLEKIRRVRKETEEKGIFTPEEFKKLFDIKHLKNNWKGNLGYFLIGLLGITAGLRKNEIQALKPKNIKQGYIEIDHGWNRKYGLQAPKYDSCRIAPIPEFTQSILDEYIEYLSLSSVDEIIFHSLTNPSKAIDHKAIDKSFYNALSSIGIDEEQRRDRNITFHSTRHTFISLLRGKISDEDMMLVVGHKNTSTTDKYTHFIKTRLEPTRKVQNELFEFAS